MASATTAPSRIQLVNLANYGVCSVSAISLRSPRRTLHLRMPLAPSTMRDAPPKASVSENAIGQVSERVVA